MKCTPHILVYNFVILRRIIWPFHASFPDARRIRLSVLSVLSVEVDLRGTELLGSKPLITRQSSTQCAPAPTEPSLASERH